MKIEVKNRKGDNHYYLFFDNYMMGCTTKEHLYKNPEKWAKQQIRARTNRIDDRIRTLNLELQRLINEREFLQGKSTIKFEISGLDLRFKWEQERDEKQLILRKEYHL